MIFFFENNKKEISYYDSNLYFIGNFINTDDYTDEKRQFIYDLFINNNKYYNEAINIFNTIKTYFNNYNNDNYIIMYITKYEHDIVYYNNLYKKNNGKDKNIIVMSPDIDWCKKQYSINKNFYFIENFENNNECIQFILMIFVSGIINNTKSYLCLLTNYVNKNYKLFI